MLLYIQAGLFVLHGPCSHDKSQNDSGGHGAFGLQEACQEMDSPSVRSPAYDAYQKRLATVLAAMRCRPKLGPVAAFVLLTLSEFQFWSY